MNNPAQAIRAHLEKWKKLEFDASTETSHVYQRDFEEFVCINSLEHIKALEIMLDALEKYQKQGAFHAYNGDAVEDDYGDTARQAIREAAEILNGDKHDRPS